MDFVEGIAILRCKIIAVGESGRALAFRIWAVEEFDYYPEDKSGRNAEQPQEPGRQARCERFSNWIDVSRNPFISFLAVHPERHASTIADARRQAAKPGCRIRQMMQYADRERQIKNRADRGIQQVANDDMRVGKCSRMRKGYERALAKVQGDNRFCPERSD